MKSKSLIFFAIIFFGILNLAAQNDDGNSFNSYYVNHYVNEIPPSPNAANFLQYGNTPVNISRGLPSISIPLYTLSVDGLEIPISLSYDASGVKVDDISSTVGLKWTLNAGGGVFRTVKDLDDLSGSGFSWIRGTTNQPHFEEWWNNIQPNYQWFEDSQNQYYIENHITNNDQWPDDFRYSFLGHSGEFKFSPNGTVIKGVNDEITLTSHTPSAPNLNGSYFTAKDQSGNHFTFSNDINNKDRNQTIATTYKDYGSYGSDGVESSAHIVGWLLDDIETRNGKQIFIEYENTVNSPDIYAFSYTINPISEQLQRLKGCGEDPCNPRPWDCVSDEDSPTYFHFYRSNTSMEYKTRSSLIRKISSENVDIEFEYLEDDIHEDNGTIKIIDGWKKRVSTIIIKDKVGLKSKKFHFKYGVFSGNQRLKLIEIQEEGFEGKLKPPYKFTYDEREPLPSLGSKSKDYKGYYNGKNNSSLIPKTNNTLLELSEQFGYVQGRWKYYKILGDRYFDVNFLSAGILTKIEYPTGGKTKFTYETNALGKNMNEPIIKARKSMVTNVDNGNMHSGYVPDVSPHNYYQFMQLLEIKNQVGFFELEMLRDCPDCSCTCPEIPKLKIYKYNGQINDDPSDYLNSNNIGDLALNVSANGEYSNFDNSNGNGLYIALLLLGGRGSEYEPNSDVQLRFKWNEKESDSTGNVVFQENYFGGLRISSVEDYDNNNNSFNHRLYTYKDYYLDGSAEFKYNNYHKSYGSSNMSAPFFIYSDIVETAPDLPLVGGYCYTNIDTKIIDSGNPQVINERFKANIVFNSIGDGLPIKKSIFNSSGQLMEYSDYIYKEESPMSALEFYTPSERIYRIVYYTRCSVLPNVKMYLSGYNEHRIRNRFYTIDNLVSTKKSTRFLEYGSTYKPVTAIESYEYNGNRLLKKETTDTRYTAQVSGDEIIGYNMDNPNGEVIEINYNYVNDPIVDPPLPTLPVSLPISKEVLNGSTKILGQYFEYDYAGNIKNTYSYNKGEGTHSGGPSYVESNYELDVSYLTVQGKPTQIQSKGGIKTSYIWGYHDQYPVAKIDNLSYNLLVNDGTVSQIQSLSTAVPYNESALITALNTIRTAYPNAQVTTYTYNPLVGISTITDPKGYKITYVYDGFGRLKYVKDMEGNVLSENQYHYKND